MNCGGDDDDNDDYNNSGAAVMWWSYMYYEKRKTFLRGLFLICLEMVYWPFSFVFTFNNVRACGIVGVSVSQPHHQWKGKLKRYIHKKRSLILQLALNEWTLYRFTI